jgi:hypothetical protein
MYQSFTEMNTSILNTLNRKSHEDASAMGASDKTTHSPRGSSHSPRGSMRDPQAYSGSSCRRRNIRAGVYIHHIIRLVSRMYVGSLRRGSQNFEGAGRGAIGGVTNLYEEGQWELFAPCWIWRISGVEEYHIYYIHYIHHMYTDHYFVYNSVTSCILTNLLKMTLYVH